MENTEDAEKSTTVGDSAYSYSCSNSKSTRSSKSTLSGSNSSGSSGYRGKRVNTDYNKTNNLLSPPEKRTRDEVKTFEVNVKTAEVKNEVQPTIESENPPSSNEDVKNGITDVYAVSPGDVGKQTDSMDVSTSEKSTFQDTDTVFCVKKENSFESRIDDPHISHIICTNYSNPLCSDGFFCVISMKDGMVMYTTLSIASVLGFPQDMWVGKSFTDFIHPNDRDAFVSHVSKDLLLWKKANVSHLEKNASSMLCRIKRHKILNSGFAIRDKKAMFKPFTLKIFFKNIIDEEDVIYLIIHAVSFAPAFKTSNEKVIDPLPFVIKHSASGSLKYMDQESVTYLGYFPQDVEDKDKDMIEMYHPADLIYLHHVYETLLDVGSYDRCKPYRMQAYNGDYVKLESEWISYVHPWSKKLECIIGKHYVLEGPTNPNIFETPQVQRNNTLTYEEGETTNSQILRDSIKRLLSKAVSKPTQLAKEQMTKKFQNVAAFMDLFIDMRKTETKEEEVEEIKSKTDSIKLGGLSSHNYTDSKSSTDTSLSYDRLNYDETLQRYFDSHAQCIASGYTSDSNLFKSNESSPDNGASMLRDPNAIPSTSSSPSTVMSQNHTIWLTKSLLNKHNEKMEKKLVKIHRKSKSTSRGEKMSEKTNLQKMNEHLNRCNKSFEPTPSRCKVKRPKTQKRRHVKYTSSARRKRAAENARRSSNTAILPCPWQANPENNINTFLMGVGISQQKSFMNTITMPATAVPMYYSTPLETTEMSGNAAHQYGMFAGEQTVPYMMYGQALCGPYTYSPVNQLPQTLDETCMRQYMPEHTRPRSKGSNGDSTDTSQSHIKKKFKLGNSDGTVYNTDGESSFSSFYSSFFKTDSGSAEEVEETTAKKDDGKFWRRKLLVDDTSSKDSKLNGDNAKKRMQPPWLEHVCVTSELIYKYQITTKSMEEVLSADREKLSKLKQPKLVNEQLGQLYLDLQLEGVASRLTLEEGITSSSSGEETTAHSSKRRRSTDTRRRQDYSKMSILYDEDAPLPPADEDMSSSAT